MPLKRRIDKRRSLNEFAPLQDWLIFFKTGHDYLRDLHRYGLATDEAARIAGADAWKRLGSEFMETWEPHASARWPWAYEEYGAPPKRGR